MEIFAEGVVDLSSPTMSCVTPFMMQTYEESYAQQEHFYDEEEEAYKVSLPLYTLIIGVQYVVGPVHLLAFLFFSLSHFDVAREALRQA